MPQGNNLSLDIQAKDIIGLLPAVDRRQVDKPFVIDGKNFLFNVKGPYSGFGRRLVTKANYQDAVVFQNTSLQSFRTVDNTAYLFTGESILAYDTASMLLYPVYTFEAQSDTNFGWTTCFIAGKHYFCRKGVGVIEYTPVVKSWKLFTNVDLVVGPVAIANARGRLIILGASAYQWSAIDNPNDLTISLTTGAGIQSTAILGGNSLKVMSLGDNFLIFTTTGAIISEFSGGQAVFRHRILTRDYKAINAVCIEQLDTDTVVFIDEKGLFTSDGGKPKSFQPLFSEFLSADLLRFVKSGLEFSNYRLFLYKPRQLLFIMVSTVGGDEHFELAYTLYLPVDKFGVFSETFHSFIELPIDTTAEIQYRFCVVEANGSIKEFNDSNYVERTVFYETAFFYQTQFDWPAQLRDGIYRFPSLLDMSAEPIWLYAGLISGWYIVKELIVGREFSSAPVDIPSGSIVIPPVVIDWIVVTGFWNDIAHWNDDEFWIDHPAIAGEFSVEFSTEFALEGLVPNVIKYIFRTEIVMDGGMNIRGPIAITPVLGGLNSEINVGLFRYAELKYDDELGVASNLSVYSGETVSQEDEDYMDDASVQIIEDWNLLTDFEDWGFGILSTDLYNVDITGTNDGKKPFLYQALVDTSYDKNDQVTRYACSVSGQYFIVGIKALNYPELYRVAGLEISGNSGGRLG